MQCDPHRYLNMQLPFIENPVLYGVELALFFILIGFVLVQITNNESKIQLIFRFISLLLIVASIIELIVASAIGQPVFFEPYAKAIIFILLM